MGIIFNVCEFIYEEFNWKLLRRIGLVVYSLFIVSFGVFVI